MKGKYKVQCVLVVVLLLPSLANPSPLDACHEHIKYGAPSQSGDLLCRLGYVLSHNPKHKTADWVAYHLTREKMKGNHPRSDDFRSDPDLEPGGRSELIDYKRSGFDRGHMAPAAAMKWSERAMSESFLLSNMAPQVGNGMNRGIWRVLEARVREWVASRGGLYIVTGNIYDDDTLKVIGPNKVAVPTHCYKVIFDPVQVEAIAFIVPNKKSQSSDLPNYIVSVDEVESRSGLDFLPTITDSIEDAVEAATATPLW